ncbi:MAG: hypothetical protein RL736_236 [Pseudomonadota bacterium]|jgi:hypothetical protein
MIVTWTAKGADWKQSIKAGIDSNPGEIATQCVENLMTSLKDEDDEASFGAIIGISHSRMKSDDEHYFMYAPLVLANAGFYEDAEALEKAIDLDAHIKE